MILVQFQSWRVRRGVYINPEQITYVAPYYLPNAKPEDKYVGTEIGLVGSDPYIVVQDITEVLDRLQEVRDGNTAG